MNKRLLIAIFLFLLGSSFLLGALWNNFFQTPAPTIQKTAKPISISDQTQIPAAAREVKVTRVVDGDTIEVESGKVVRYIGMDTPETVDPRRPVACFGKEASLKNKELVDGKKVRLEKDISETDKYGRLLRYVYVGDLFVNDYLVREGYAKASSYPPDIKYQEKFLEAEREAREKNLGLWAGCGISITESPVQKSSGGQISGNCLIKGNISSTGEKIYHMIGQQYYNKTVVDESRGEKWFCSEEEAISSGWRKSKV